MKIAVFPDCAMIIEHIVNKRGHEVLSATNISEDDLREKDPYDDSDFDRNAPPFNMEGYSVMTGNKYTSSEVPSGVRGRLCLYDNILSNAEATIILGRKTRKAEQMYNTLNNLILFGGGTGCYNTYKIIIKYLRKMHIPSLYLDYPNNRDELIDMIGSINNFLDALDNNEYGQYMNSTDNINCDNKPNSSKISVDVFRDIVDNL
ncbi:DUF2112 family protein [Methanosphaera sp. WGK6]|uniref:DUF2112 family protein n=1 Tax=Methanosphaera sp. WGK6 TaxID=1561964 RepID=UPI00084BF8DD|nr:DUF2112 family protein [Methanosphaera sp. WGK6]OED29899.1 hypothetical protein NL43_05670 [Methanosphaera sp. WGK6]